jgi:hypothetical protein
MGIRLCFMRRPQLHSQYQGSGIFFEGESCKAAPDKPYSATISSQGLEIECEHYDKETGLCSSPTRKDVEDAVTENVCVVREAFVFVPLRRT